MAVRMGIWVKCGVRPLRSKSFGSPLSVSTKEHPRPPPRVLTADDDTESCDG